MIVVKNKDQIEKMKKSGALVRDVLKLLEDETVAGMSTLEVCKRAADYIKKHDAVPSFLHYNGYPAAICVSVNEEVVHGIPRRDKILTEGDIVGVDVGVKLNGYHGDAARTLCIGSVSPERLKLVQTAEDAFKKSLDGLKEGKRVGDIGYAVQTCAEERGFSVVRDLIGHGIGTALHEDPDVPNFGKAGKGARLSSGMTVAIEPMVNAGGYAVNTLSDGWTVVTRDGKPSAHYENTVVILSDGAEILT